MPYFLNAIYLIGALAASPFLVYKSLTTRKYRRGLWSKLHGRSPQRMGKKPCAWFHGVSVGEIHLLDPIVMRFLGRHPDWHCVISTTTDTGLEEGRKRFPGLEVFYWPIDFSWAVTRALDRVRPKLVVLAEGEVWPNFVWAAHARSIPVAVINGRMSPRSFKRYRRVRLLARSWLKRVGLCAAQTESYAESFRELGVPVERVRVTGSVKYDGVSGDRANARTQELRRLLSVTPGDLVWIAGSTQAPEEAIVVDTFRRLKRSYPYLRLVLVPRQKDRFEEVAAFLARSALPFVRRTRLTKPLEDRSAIVLVDTIGELSALWGLADIAFVGGSLDGRRGGQNMIEPAAYGAAVLFGPHTWNFRDTVARLLEANAAIQVADSTELERSLVRLLSEPAERQRLGEAAQRLVLSQQGATERTLDCLDQLLTAGLSGYRAA